MPRFARGLLLFPLLISIENNMITTKILSGHEIEDACALLYEVYIEHAKWKFLPDNPSHIRIEIKHNKKILIDGFTEQALWFGVFDENLLVGCVRLCNEDRNGQFEIEGYPNSQIIHKYLLKKSSFEMGKLAIKVEYKGKKIVHRLFLAAFRYCEKNSYSVFTSTHNGFLKALYKKIAYPLKVEHAFKYEPNDPLPINFYSADHHQSEIKKMISALEFLDVDLTQNSTAIFRGLSMVAPILPTPVYWHDVNGVVLGINEHCLKAIGTSREIIGKTPYEFYPKEIAEHILTHNELVIRTGEIMSQEERIEDITTGEIKYFSAIKSPLYDDEGNIIGIVGTSVDITAEKEAAHLKLTHLKLELENEVHKNLAQEQEKFMAIANQVAHDIRSPLASLLMIVKSCTEIPEAERIALREAAIGIGDIANHLLSQYQKREIDTGSEVEEPQPILMSALLLQLLTDKKYQHHDLAIKFHHEFNQAGQFSFIKMEPSAFKRMISNVINNAVDACHQQAGKVNLYLEADNEWVKIRIQDNGQGMPAALVNQLMNHVAITVGKEAGHGIGLTQVHDALERNHGELAIDSVPDEGTVITLTFPRISAPHWIAEEIQLREDDTVIILDDDHSIHGAWATHFEPILKKAPRIQLKHFQTAKETLAFIAALSSTEKQHVFLLTDYELLKQELNGLQVIAESQIERAILVTSHYTNPLVREQAAKTGTKILPKQLASEIFIHIEAADEKKDSAQGLKKVDAVIVDDNENFVTNLILFAFDDHHIVDPYHNPDHFLKQVNRYPKDTKIYLDHNFSNSRLRGTEIAKLLHAQGYTRLHLLSGDVFNEDKIPHYLTVIPKDNLDTLKALCCAP